MSEQASVCEFQPEGELTIYTAADIKSNLVALLEKKQPLEINLSAVDEMDSAGLQLLILAKRAAQQRDLEVSFVDHSPAVLEVLELCNMTGIFGDPVLMPHNDSTGSTEK